MNTAEITSLLLSTNGNVEEVSKILQDLDIGAPLAGPRGPPRRKRRTEVDMKERSSAPLRTTGGRAVALWERESVKKSRRGSVLLTAC